jgi:hypothetical protein
VGGKEGKKQERREKKEGMRIRSREERQEKEGGERKRNHRGREEEKAER